MAGSVVKQAKSANAASSGAKDPGSGKSTKLLMVGAALLGLIVVQVVVTYLQWPGAAQSQSNQKHEEAEQAAPGRHDSHHELDEGGFAEVSLGEFSVSNTTAARGIITHVDFRLVGLASPNQASTLDSQIKRSQGRVREAVNKIVRNSNLDELNDPNLEAIKRQVREDINALLGKRLIIDVVVNDIRIIQQ